MAVDHSWPDVLPARHRGMKTRNSEIFDSAQWEGGALLLAMSFCLVSRITPDPKNGGMEAFTNPRDAPR
jgi:hypothetical protein